MLYGGKNFLHGASKRKGIAGGAKLLAKMLRSFQVVPLPRIAEVTQACKSSLTVELMEEG